MSQRRPVQRQCARAEGVVGLEMQVGTPLIFNADSVASHFDIRSQVRTARKAKLSSVSVAFMAEERIRSCHHHHYHCYSGHGFAGSR